MKKVLIISIICLCLILAFFLNKKEDTIMSFALNTEIELYNNDLKIDWKNKKEYKIDLEKTITIDKEGIYYLSGNIDNGFINVDTLGYVKLILNNVKVENNNGLALIIKNAKMVIIELEDESVNKFIDGKDYENKKYNGCIYSSTDLVFQGNGTLDITSNYKHGIVSEDNIKITNGNYIINSNDDGINSRDSIHIINGNFEVNSKGDSFKTTNEEELKKGFIYIENGGFNIKSYNDGFDAGTNIIIENIDLRLNTKYEVGKKNSKKGIKANSNLIIKNGNYSINTYDDCINVNKDILIKNGEFNLETSDDAINAKDNIIIKNGNYIISKAYEGIEASNITIDDGKFLIKVEDDAINVKKDDDLEETDDLLMVVGNLIINGGEILINALGDGIDVNGNIIINDGVVIIDGPINYEESAIDYNGYFNVNGGYIIGLSGSSEMVMKASEDSKQRSLMYFLKKKINNVEFVIEDEKGNILFEHECIREVKNIFVSSNEIKENGKYILKVNGEELGVMVSKKTFTHNNSGNDKIIFKD